MLRWILCACIVAGCAPSRVAGVACSNDGDCKLSGVAGKCEPTKFCSYPDPTCSGGRYSPGAGSGLGNTCVGGCGDKDQACCGGMVCATNLTCNSSMTCSCGNTGEPCCDATTCSANNTCTSEGACACGGVGEPCCDGTTCNNGLSCSGGTCDGGVLEVAVGEAHTCALRSDHTVSCWGFDWKPYSYHAVGMSVPIIASTTPYTIPGLTDVVAIRSGGRHTCATKSDGTLWCWGHNESGQLGDGTYASSAKPVQVAGMSGVTMFDLGRFHTCAVGAYQDAPGLYCWGQASYGGHAGGPNTSISRLGNHGFLDQPAPSRADLSAATAAGQTIRSLSTGANNSCVAMSDNTVWCWGSNNLGQLGTGNTTSTLVPVAASLAGFTIPAGAAIAEVTCTRGQDRDSSCLRLTNGAVYCWGSDNYGELGDGTTATMTRNAPTAPATTTALGGATFTQLASGAGFHCGLASNGSVYCWGHGFRGVLGNGDTTDANQSAPVQVMGLTNATQVFASHHTACAVDNANQLLCWGTNRKYQQAASAPEMNVATKVPL
jgi:alpha-tubulin suppressor-like RCC1 family protein